MRVLITGGIGLIGRAVTEWLQARGWDTHIIDVAPESEDSQTPYTVCDITDYDALREQMRGCDAVVHMAAIRSPFYAPSQEIFRINVAGTFNVFEAAAAEGIKRVVQASSINAIGCAFNLGDFTPGYFPIDEDHPLSTSDPYSFSKQMIEDIGAYYWRRDGISSVALRFPGVYQMGFYKSQQYYERRNATRALLDKLLNMPEAEREQHLANARSGALAFRAARMLEYPNRPGGAFSDDFETRLLRAYNMDRYNLWVVVDERDAAQSVEKSLTADYEGSHPLFINDHHNYLDYDSHVLASLFFPDVTEWKQPIAGSEALVSIEKARKLIGFEPEYSIVGESND